MGSNAIDRKRTIEPSNRELSATKKSPTKKKIKKIKKKKKAEEEEEEGNALKKRTTAMKRTKNFPKFDPKAGSSLFGVDSVKDRCNRRWILDLRSDFRFFSLFSFCCNFSKILMLPEHMTCEELEKMLLWPEENTKIIELVCRLIEEDECDLRAKDVLTIGDWEGKLQWLCGEFAEENPDEFPSGNSLDIENGRTFYAVDPMTRLDILCALCEDRCVQSEIVRANVLFRAEKAFIEEKRIELEREKKEKKRNLNFSNERRMNGGAFVLARENHKIHGTTTNEFTDEITAEIMRDRDVHGDSVGSDSEGNVYFTLGDASPRVWRWDRLKSVSQEEAFSFDGVEPAWITVTVTLEETEALALVLAKSSGTKDRELASYLTNAFIPLHAMQRAFDIESKTREENKIKAQEVKEKKLAEYNAKEKAKRSGRIADLLKQQEEQRLQKLAKDKEEIELIAMRKNALIKMNDEARRWMFLPLRLREKTQKPKGLSVEAFVVQKGNRKPKASLTDPSAKLVSLADINGTRKKQRPMGAACVNKLFEIFWPEDQTWYSGFAESYDAKTGMHFIVYTDGSTERVNLDKLRTKYKYDVEVSFNGSRYSWKKIKKKDFEKPPDSIPLIKQEQEREREENDDTNKNAGDDPLVMLEYVTGHNEKTVLALDCSLFDVSKFSRHNRNNASLDENDEYENDENENDEDALNLCREAKQEGSNELHRPDQEIVSRPNARVVVVSENGVDRVTPGFLE